MPSCERIRATCFKSAGAGSPRRSVVIWIVSPWTATFPEFGISSRLIQRRSVLLPEPDAPSIEITSPVCATSDTPRSTSTSPKRLCKSSTISAGSVVTECSNVIRQTFLTGYGTLTRFPSRPQSFFIVVSYRCAPAMGWLPEVDVPRPMIDRKIPTMLIKAIPVVGFCDSKRGMSNWTF